MSENRNERLHEQPLKNVETETALPVDITREQSILSDGQLRYGGLTRIDAWIKSEKSTASDRVAKHRKKLAEIGVRPVNVTATKEAHALIKKIAAKSREGLDVNRIIQVLADEEGNKIDVTLEREIERLRADGDRLVKERNIVVAEVRRLRARGWWERLLNK